MKPRRPQASIWYVAIGILLALFIVQQLARSSAREEIAYGDFKTLLRAGRIADVELGEGSVAGTLLATGADQDLSAEGRARLAALQAGRHAFTAVRVADPDLVRALEAAKVPYRGQAESKWLPLLLSWLLPVVGLVAVWSIFLRAPGATGGLLAVGKARPRVAVQQQVDVRFADVAGIDEAKGELVEIVDFLKNPDKYRRLGGAIPKGVLIVGPPGTGKTLLAKAVAGEAGVAFFSMSGSEFVELFVGVGAARVRDLFAQAEAAAPCIIFIDELDALAKARGVGALSANEEREQTLNQLLVEMDGFDTGKGVIILAATNRPEILDPAILRPGRFDRQIALDRPDIRGREQILRVHVKRITLAPNVDLAALAGQTAGFSGADLANVTNEAALLAARHGKAAVEAADFTEAIDRVVGGLEKKTRVMNAREKETVAYHEAGHALVAELRPTAVRVGKVSIIPRGIAALGYTQQVPTEDRYLMRKSELLDRLDVLLAGRAAEEIAFGDVSTGAQDDLQRATELAWHMVAQYGMSTSCGLGSFDRSRPPVLPVPGVPRAPREYSERTAEAIDAEIRSLLDSAHGRVREILVDRRVTLDALARELLAHEVVERETLVRIIHAPPDRAARAGAAAAAEPVAGIGA